MQTPEMEKGINDHRFYIETLKGDECLCERWKRRGMAFCYGCYKKLPTEMQRALYQPIGRGFEGAYNEAVAYLSD